MTNDPELTTTRPSDLAEPKELAGMRQPPVIALGALHRQRGLVGGPPSGHDPSRTASRDTNIRWQSLTAEAVIAASLSLGVAPSALLQILPLRGIQ